MNVNVTIESLLAEKEALEKEIKATQLDLSDTYAINVALHEENKRKELMIAQKTQQLSELRAGNQAGIEQGELELSHSHDRYHFDTKQREQQIAMLGLTEKRFLDLMRENEHLRDSVQLIRDQIQDKELEHASTIHDINTDMKLTRHQMEATLKRELTSLDMNYQAEAFLLLSDKQKRAMLVNAKLKDEVAIQGVGIANLSVRLEKQRLAYDQTKQDLKELNATARVLRTKLGKLGLGKLNATRNIEALQQEVKILEQKKADLALLINENPTRMQIESEMRQIQSQLPEELRKAQMWRKRKELLQATQSDIKPVTLDESVGFFSTKLFPLAELPVDMQAGPTIPPPAFQRQVNEEQAKYTSPSRPLTATGTEDASPDNVFVNSGVLGTVHNPDLVCGILPIAFTVDETVKKNHVKLTDIAAARKADKYLDLVFRGLKGRESILLATMNKDGVPTQNMIAWTAYEIIRIFNETSELQIGQDFDHQIDVIKSLLEFNEVIELEEKDLEDIGDGDIIGVPPLMESTEIPPTVIPANTSRFDGSKAEGAVDANSDSAGIRSLLPGDIGRILDNPERQEFENMWSSILNEELSKADARRNQRQPGLRAATAKELDISTRPSTGGETEMISRPWYQAIAHPNDQPSTLLNTEWMHYAVSDNLMNKDTVRHSLEIRPPVINARPLPSNAPMLSSVKVDHSTIMKLANEMNFFGDDGNATVRSTSLKARRQQNATLDPLAPKKSGFSAMLRKAELEKEQRELLIASGNRNRSQETILPRIKPPVALLQKLAKTSSLSALSTVGSGVQLGGTRSMSNLSR